MKNGLPLFLFVMVFAGSLALPQSNTPPTKPAVKKTAPKTTTAAKKKVSSKTGKSTKSAKTPAAVAATTWRNRQMEPTPERYKEIQQALVEKGYLKSEPNGVWDTESSAALLQFQTDKKLSPTGKLSSASLIALGLGPKTADSSPSSAGVNGDPLVAPPPATPPAIAPEN
jgi:hypothetical protein